MTQSAAESRSELLFLTEGVSEDDISDGAGEVIAELLEGCDGGPWTREIRTVADLKGAILGLPAALDGGIGLDECNHEKLLRALRLLWAGYYREVVLEQKRHAGEEGYRAASVRRFKESVLRLRGIPQGKPADCEHHLVEGSDSSNIGLLRPSDGQTNLEYSVWL